MAREKKKSPHYHPFCRVRGRDRKRLNPENHYAWPVRKQKTSDTKAP